MAIANAPILGDFGGQKLGIQLSSMYNPVKHLESNSFAGLVGPEMVWLGIMNYLEMYEQNYSPLVSVDEMTKNTVYIDSDRVSFLYGVPYRLGCPFIMEVLCENSKLGYDGTTFHVVISENLYTYNDILMVDRRHGKGLRIIPVSEGGEDAKIIPYGGGYRFLLGMSSGDAEDYVDHAELYIGSEVERVDFSGGDEFKSDSTSYTGNLLSSGSHRYGMDMYQYNLGTSDLSLSYLMTAKASLRDIKMNKVLPQMNGLPVEASSDIINFFSKKQYLGSDARGNAKLGGVTMWIPKFLVNIGKELKDLLEIKNMFSPGWTRSNGREVLYGGKGLYQQIKDKGNHFYYQTAAQAFDLIKNMLTSLYAGKYNIPIKDRKIDIELGDGIYELIQPMLHQYFESDNKLIITAEHPAFKDVVIRKPDGSISYHPIEFTEVYYPNFGTINIRRNTSLGQLDNYKKTNKFIGRHPESAYMIFIKDVTDKTFTKANVNDMNIGPNQGNILYVKRKGVPDSMEFTVGSGYIAPELLSAVGARSDGGHSRDSSFNGLKITMRTHGEVFLQDASRMVIAEYDPTGEREAQDRNMRKAPLM